MEFFFIPTALTVSAAILLWLGFRKPKPNYVLVALCLGLLLGVCIYMITFAVSGGLGGAVAFMLSLFTTIIALIAGLTLAVELRGRRKLAALIFILIYPAALFGCSIIAFDFSPERQSRRYAAVIGQQLDQYRSDNGHYPAELAELVPTYIDDLKEPTSIWGWLYKATQDEFTLGYVSSVEWWGYDVCVYTSAHRTWECPTGFSSAPFNLPPTPQSTPFPTLST